METDLTKYDLQVDLGLASKGQSSGRIVIGFNGDNGWYAVTLDASRNPRRLVKYQPAPWLGLY